MAKEKDPFAEFKDWLVDGPAGEWPEPWEKDKDYTPEQQTIVKDNAALLLDRDAWKKRVDAFERAIRSLKTEDEQIEKRAVYHIRFDGFYFGRGDKDFSDYQFPCTTDFRQVSFRDGNVSFVDARFEKGKLNFSNVEFGAGTINFSGVQCCGRGANFKNTQFGRGDVDFSFARFGNGDVDFSDTVFLDGDVSFAQANFEVGNVYFNRTKFGNGEAIFIETQFGQGRVDFSDAIFGEGNVYLTELKLSATTLSASDMVVCHLYVKADFPLEADFQRLKVTETASFSGCKFEQVPDFRDAKFDRPPDVANMEVSRPKLKKDRFWPFSTAADDQDASRLRKLKAMALDASDHERDSYFFAREMLAKRGVETKSWPGLLLNTLYDWLSVYGYSFLRPLGWLAASLVFFFCIYVCVVQDNFGLSSMLCFAALHSGLNFLPLIGGLFRYAPTPEKYTSPYEKLYAQLPDADITLLVTLGIVQSIIGGILLFLFLLALRNRFRLK